MQLTTEQRQASHIVRRSLRHSPNCLDRIDARHDLADAIQRIGSRNHEVILIEVDYGRVVQVNSVLERKEVAERPNALEQLEDVLKAAGPVDLLVKSSLEIGRARV